MIAEKRRAYLRSVGRPSKLRDDEFRKVQSRLKGFKARGMSYAQMADQVELPANTVRFACTSRTGMFRSTAESLARVRFEPPAPTAPVDPTGSRRRLQALRRDGFSLPLIAEQANLGKRSLWKLADGRCKYVLASTSTAIAELYDQLESKTPGDFGVTRREVTFVSTFAAKRGYAPRHCWDPDTIDDPEAIPEWTGACGTAEGLRIHQREGIPACPPCSKVNLGPGAGAIVLNPEKLKAARDKRGLSHQEIGDLLGVHNSTVHYWETGRSGPRSRNLIDRYLAILDLNPEDAT